MQLGADAVPAEQDASGGLPELESEIRVGVEAFGCRVGIFGSYLLRHLPSGSVFFCHPCIHISFTSSLT